MISVLGPYEHHGSYAGPDQVDVDALRDLLDLMKDFNSNDQRARFLLSSNWLRDRGAEASKRLLGRDES